MWDIAKPSRRHPRALGDDPNGAFWALSEASRAPNDTPHRVGARSYPKTPRMRLYRFLLPHVGIGPAANRHNGWDWHATF